MRDKFRKYRIYIYIIGVVFSVFFAFNLYFSFKFNFNEIVIETLKKYAGLNVEFKKVSFPKIGIIELRDVILKDKNEKILVNTPILILKYDRKSFSKITEIRVKDAKINFEMYGDYDINFVDAFKSKGTDKKSQSILKRIVVEESIFYYRDKMNPKEIYKKLNLSLGTIDFNKNSEILIKADAVKDKEKYKFNMNYKNKNDYEIGIKLENIPVDNIVMQYGYTSEDIDYKSGLAKLDLKIKPHGYLYGKAKMVNGVAAYSDLTESIKNGIADVEFNGRDIEVKIFGEVGKRKSNINIKYSLEKKETNISMELKKIDLEKEKNIYKPIKKMELPVSGEIDKLSINILIDKNKNTKLNLKYSAPKIVYKNVNIENIMGEAEYFADKIFIKNNKFKIEDYVSANLDMSGIIKNGSLKAIYKLDNIKSDIDCEKLEGKIEYNGKINNLILTADNGNKLNSKAEIDLKNSKVKAELKSIDGLVFSYDEKKVKFVGNLKGSYDIDKDYLGIEIKTENGSNFEYEKEKSDFRMDGNFILKLLKEEIVSGKGSFQVKNIKGIDEVSSEFTIEDSFINLENTVLKKGRSFAYLKGYYSINTEKYAFNVINSEIALKDMAEKEEMKGYILAEGIISGNSLKEAEGMLEVKSSEGTVKGIGYKNLDSTLNIIYKNNKFKISGTGEIKETSYKNEKLEELNFNFRYNDNAIYIDNLYNNSLTLKGYYNIITENVNFDFVVRKYKIENIELIKEKKIQGYVENVNGKIEGEISNPKLKLEVKNLMISYDMYRNILFNGIVLYENGEIKAENLKVNQNSITGKYNLKTGDIEAKLNLFENNLCRYLGQKEIKLRTIGEVVIWGNKEDLKAMGNINCDNIYYKDKKIPEMAVKFTYNKGNIENFRKSGIFSITSLDVLTQNKEKIVSAVGFINFENDKINIEIKDYNIDVSKIEYIKTQTNNSINGNLNLNFSLNGSFSDFNYSSKLKSEGIKLFDNEINGIDIEIEGNKEEILLKKADINYGGNRFYAGGKLKYTPFLYEFNLNGSNIDLKFLNIFAKDKLKNIFGQADINLNISNSEAMGSLKLRNVNFESQDGSINIKNLNVSTILEQNKLKIFESSGNINEGKVSCSGEIILSSIQPDKFKINNFKAESWNLNVYFDNLKYNSGNYLVLNLGGNIQANDKNIKGKVEIQSGLLKGIPQKQKKENIDNEISIPKDWNALIDVQVNKKFKVDITDYLLIESLEANLEGNGRIKLENGNLNFLGTISTDEGVIEVNKNFFEIESGVIVFDDPGQYYPDLNPSLAIKAVTDVVKEEITVGVTGYLNKPNVLLSSSSNLGNDDIISLLAFHKTLSDTTAKGVLKDILAKQLSEEIFNPLSQKLSKTLGIEKVKISSNLLEDSENDEELKFTKDLRLGASMEFGDRIYKDIFYWNAKAKLSDKTAGKMDSFNIWFDYKILEWLSLSLGVERKPDTPEDEKGNIHIGLDVNKKFDFNF